MSKSPSKKLKKKVKETGYAVMNMELGVPCVEIGKEDFPTGSAIYFSDWPGQAKLLAQDYIKRNFPDKKFPSKTKIVKVTLFYET